jgi:hypothetical protein
MKTLSAPLGYKLTNKIDAENEKEVLKFMLNLSDDPDWLRNVALDNHKHRLKVLKKNGFTIVTTP